MIGWMLDQAVGWILGSVRDALNAVWKLLAHSLFHVPDVTGMTQVQSLAGRSLLIVNTSYVLAIMVTGLVVMTHGSLQIRYGAGELLPRLVLGLCAANFAIPVSRLIIDTSNTLVLGLTGQGIAGDGALPQLLSIMLVSLLKPASLLLSTVIGLVLVVLVVLLMTGWITRFVWLVVLCGVAPLALACHGTPWTDGVARLWWRSIGGVCLTVVAQALVMNEGLQIFLSPSSDLARYGLPGKSNGLRNLFIVAVLLWITVQIPALVRRYLTQAGGRQNIVGALVRVVIAQQVTRRVGTLAQQAVRGNDLPAVRGAHHSGGGRHATGPERRLA